MRATTTAAAIQIRFGERGILPLCTPAPRLPALRNLPAWPGSRRGGPPASAECVWSALFQNSIFYILKSANLGARAKPAGTNPIRLSQRQSRKLWPSALSGVGCRMGGCRPAALRPYSHTSPLLYCYSFRCSPISPHLHFAPLNFFLFLVRRYAVHFAPPPLSNSHSPNGLRTLGGALFDELRPGGGTLFTPGGAEWFAASGPRGSRPAPRVDSRPLRHREICGQRDGAVGRPCPNWARAKLSQNERRSTRTQFNG
jgi:hypothetical protein